VPLIAMAHEIPYVATATVADLHDLEAKVDEAMEIRGARYLHIHVPCPLGWGARRPTRSARAPGEVETGLFPVFEAEHGEVTGVSKIRRRRAGRGVPAPAAPLRAPVRRSRPRDRDDRAHPGGRRPQHRAASAARRATEPRRRSAMTKPFAITLDVGSSLANHTGSWRTSSGRSTSTACRRATTPARPARTSSSWLYHAESGDYERPGARSCEDNPLPAVMGRVCYHPCETACNRASSTSGRHQRGRALPRRRGDPRGLALAPPPPTASACSSSAPARRAVAAYHLRRSGHA
jgi:hypothetical protein